MIQVSTEFKQAIASGKPQRPLIVFDHTSDLGVILDEQDISIEDGIHLSQHFNTETDLTMGGCPSSTLSFTMFNDQEQLADFPFGTFKASLGVITWSSTQRVPDDLIVCQDPAQNTRFVQWYNGSLWLKTTRTTFQPRSAPSAMYLKGTLLIVIDANGDYQVARISDNDIVASSQTLANASVQLMKNKFKQWAKQHVGIGMSDKAIFKYQNKTLTRWEYAPLGVFVADKPKVMNKQTVALDCKDQMSLFDEECDDLSVKSRSLYQILQLVCQFCGVTLATKQADLMNSDFVVPNQPSEMSTATYRDIVSWIAQMTCTYARFNRDGELQLTWFGTHQTSATKQSLTEADYESCGRYWYETKPINKLVVRSSDTSKERVIGGGDESEEVNAYVIENNPFLRGGY